MPKRNSSTHHRHPGPRHAFTLIELLVVISIVALLIAVLLPVLSRAKFQAEKVKCLANLRATNMAIQMYTIDEDGHFPINQSLLQSNSDYDYFHWIEKVLPYVGNGLQSPTGAFGYNDREKYAAIQCPGDASGLAVGGDNRGFVYSIVHDLMWKWRTTADTPPGNPQPHGDRSFTIDEIPSISDKGLVMDNGQYAAVLHGGMIEIYGLRGHPSPGISTPNHNGRGVSVSYMDGRAEFVAPLFQGSPGSANPAPLDAPWRFKKFWVNPGWGYDNAPLN